MFQGNKSGFQIICILASITIKHWADFSSPRTSVLLWTIIHKILLIRKLFSLRNAQKVVYLSEI